MGKFNIAVVSGDGIGPEVTAQAERVLEKIGSIYDHTFEFCEVIAGGAAIDAVGECLPQETLDKCLSSDSVLLGAVGGPKWDNVPGDQRPERALLGLRKAMGLFANLRPAIIHPSLKDACPLKPHIIGDGLDILIVRELTGGIYFGERGRRMGELGEEAYDVECYSETEIRRIAVTAFDAAMKRSKHVTSIDKANVMESSRFWRSIVNEVAKDYPEVKLDYMFVDNASMQLIKDPHQFDVILTTNMFGDILSDEAGMITGSIGLLPSASLGSSTLGMYEPVHGSAPDIANQGKANPIAAILTAAMMLRYSFNLSTEAEAIETAVELALDEGCRTADIATEGEAVLSTAQMCDEILARLK
ncbi:MAG: 3-isopropylmalate dehydrogenase [Clostridia bacterium]|nr:3-isopropylmalate dehydrogenase [Clostridia bacterium]